jgi:hypothetical protein
MRPPNRDFKKNDAGVTIRDGESGVRRNPAEREQF